MKCFRGDNVVPLVSEMIDQFRDRDLLQDCLVHSIAISVLNSEENDSERELVEVV